MACVLIACARFKMTGRLITFADGQMEAHQLGTTFSRFANPATSKKLHKKTP
jgi:hypothetical protein